MNVTLLWFSFISINKMEWVMFMIICFYIKNNNDDYFTQFSKNYQNCKMQILRTLPNGGYILSPLSEGVCVHHQRNGTIMDSFKYQVLFYRF